MNPISLPYHLFIPSCITFLILIIIGIYRKRIFNNPKYRWTWTCIIIFLVLYLLIVSSATFQDIYYQQLVNSYDLNQDGLFTNEEITPESNEALRKLTSDTGRNFSFITGFIFAIIVSTLTFIIGKLLIIITNTSKQKDL